MRRDSADSSQCRQLDFGDEWITRRTYPAAICRGFRARCGLRALVTTRTGLTVPASWPQVRHSIEPETAVRILEIRENQLVSSDRHGFKSIRCFRNHGDPAGRLSVIDVDLYELSLRCTPIRLDEKEV